MSDDEETPKTRLERLIASPDTMDMISAHLASGGTLVDMVATLDVSYGKLMTWINKDDARVKILSAALEARNEWCYEQMDKELHDTMLTAASDSEGSSLKYASKLKAIDMLLKRHGRYIDKHEHSGTLKLDELIGGSWPKKPEDK